MSGIKDLAAKGRNGDNTLMHVSADEVAGLNALARETMGRDLTTNPETGLPEAFLFAPLAAPLLAPAGAGALGIGLTAGALGAAEAELRGMEDPLKRGLFAGLTAGAASGVGNALKGAAPDAAAANVGFETAPTTVSPDVSQAVLDTPGPVGAADGMRGASMGAMGGAPAPTTSPTPFNAPLTNTPGAPTTPGGLRGAASGPMGGLSTGPQQPGPLGQYGDIPQMAEGAKNIFRDEAARSQFMQDVRTPAMAGFVGLGGQAQMSAQDELKSKQEAADRESAAELKEAQDRIRANYAAVGRPMPTGFGGGPLFADGGIVNLRRGGRVGGPGGGSDPGNRGGGTNRGGSSSRGGVRASSHPGRPGGEAGERSMTRSAGSSSAAVKAPARLDPDKIRAAVISPADEFVSGIKQLIGMSPTIRALQHLTRDRRGLGGSSPHGPGAPLTLRERGIDPTSGTRAGTGTKKIPRPTPAPITAAEPTMSLTAERNPTANEQAFLAALQQGAGSRAAMQQTGYGMAQGGYLDGGMLPGDGMSDDVPATIDGDQPAALSSGEFVVPADVVSHIGNGSSDAGAKELYAMMDRIREARTGTDEQAPKVNTRRMMPK